MLNLLKALVLGVIEGITEWLPISSTGHLILADEFIRLDMSDAFVEMFNVVVQLGAILAVVVLFWGKLWPFGNDRTAVRRKGEGAAAYFVRRWCVADTWIMWFKVLVAILPAMVVGLPLDDWMTEHLHTARGGGGDADFVRHPVHLDGKPAQKRRASRASRVCRGPWRLASACSRCSASCRARRARARRSSAPCCWAATRTVAAEFTFFLAIPVMFGASLIKVLKFGLDFTGAEVNRAAGGHVVGVHRVDAVHPVPDELRQTARLQSVRLVPHRAGRALVLLYFLALKPLLG